MAIKRVKTNGSGPNVVAKNLEVGQEYEGRLVYVADLGLHRNVYMGQDKGEVRKLSLGIEILGETVEVDGVECPRLVWSKPFNIYYTMNALGAEFRYYKIFCPSAKEDEVADWDKVLGEPCSVTFVHVKDKKDSSKVYDNVDNILPIPKKYHKGVPEAMLEPAVGDADDQENPATKSLHSLAKWMHSQRIIEDESVANAADIEEEVVYDDDGDIPF